MRCTCKNLVSTMEDAWWAKMRTVSFLVKSWQFLQAFADWVETYETSQFSGCKKFTLNKANFTCVDNHASSHSMFNRGSVERGYAFVLTVRFQSDLIERHFSKYRQMSGGRFLVALREVQSSEKILQMKSLAKAGFNFWKMDLHPSVVHFDMSIVESVSNEIQDCELDEKSTEISVYVAGFITKKLSRTRRHRLVKVASSC